MALSLFPYYGLRSGDLVSVDALIPNHSFGALHAAGKLRNPSNMEHLRVPLDRAS